MRREGEEPSGSQILRKKRARIYRIKPFNTREPLPHSSRPVGERVQVSFQIPVRRYFRGML